MIYIPFAFLISNVNGALCQSNGANVFNLAKFNFTNLVFFYQRFITLYLASAFVIARIDIYLKNRIRQTLLRMQSRPKSSLPAVILSSKMRIFFSTELATLYLDGSVFANASLSLAPLSRGCPEGEATLSLCSRDGVGRALLPPCCAFANYASAPLPNSTHDSPSICPLEPCPRYSHRRPSLPLLRPRRIPLLPSPTLRSPLFLPLYRHGSRYSYNREKL